MNLTIKVTREVTLQSTYIEKPKSTTQTVVDVVDTNLGSEALTAKYLRALADEIDPPKVMSKPHPFATGGVVRS